MLDSRLGCSSLRLFFVQHAEELRELQNASAIAKAQLKLMTTIRTAVPLPSPLLLGSSGGSAGEYKGGADGAISKLKISHLIHEENHLGGRR